MKDDAFRVLRCIKQLRLADEKSIAQGVLLKEKRYEVKFINLLKPTLLKFKKSHVVLIVPLPRLLFISIQTTTKL